MSLKKLLTGNPGNIQEFTELIIDKSKPVSVVIHSWSEALQTGDEAWSGKLIYSSGNLAEVLSGVDIRYTQSPHIFGGGILGECWTRDHFKKALLDSAKEGLDYLSQNGVSYKVLFSDSP